MCVLLAQKLVEWLNTLKQELAAGRVCAATANQCAMPKETSTVTYAIFHWSFQISLFESAPSPDWLVRLTSQLMAGLNQSRVATRHAPRATAGRHCATFIRSPLSTQAHQLTLEWSFHTLLEVECVQLGRGRGARGARVFFAVEETG